MKEQQLDLFSYLWQHRRNLGLFGFNGSNQCQMFFPKYIIAHSSEPIMKRNISNYNFSRESYCSLCGFWILQLSRRQCTTMMLWHILLFFWHIHDKTTCAFEWQQHFVHTSVCFVRIILLTVVKWSIKLWYCCSFMVFNPIRTRIWGIKPQCP